ncbi:O-succinylhomoserine sulfhydrylase [Thiohalophilus thiocyanatoxydans]|uniref:O-succinylhomoserine sulfhydrylase n=1 Tax=Thiohalophilus thiocyanatoxydans TaxID=381308 RepID=A0A4R8IS88_9GAMM|nr:O-succinylhomoserine sulfhydrylase [Thiohalophilus thiocyanatoxydans]TDY00043.1 O-succinylhomoserine sulfhydrylase [Thiohalophilus thiocyanatoxydans]
MTDFDDEWAVETLAVRAGQVRTGENEHSEPIFTTSSYVFANAAEAAARFKGESPGNIYSRFTNPTVRTFEQRLAAMEGGQCCVATASGMSAILSTCMGLLQQGDHIVSSRSIFGTTVVLFDKYLSRAGIETSYVPLTDLEAWQQAIRPNTRLLFLETPSNPLTEVADIQALADLAHANDCLLVVDNCFCTPVLQQPFKLGADIVIHSATKYIDGQGRCIGGAVVGDNKLVGEEVFGFLRSGGPSLSPFNAWVFLKGLETLNVRMKAHSDNAQELAEYLQQHAKVTRVFYPGLTDHPQHELASRQQIGYGGVLAFEVAGGQEAAWKLIDRTRLLSITANLGDAKSTITHPATTTHGRLSDEQRAESGITPGLVRIAVGLENVGDIIADLERGLV